MARERPESVERKSVERLSVVASNALRRPTLLRSYAPRPTLAGRNPEERICFCTSP